MRVLVCEYVTGGGFLHEPLPTSLAREGDLMVRALLRDLAAIPGIDPVVVRDARLPSLKRSGEVVFLEEAADPWASWAAMMTGVDAVWPIAPETGGALERLSALALERGCSLLGSRPAAVRVCASKLATARLLTGRGVCAVPTSRLAEAPLAMAATWVAKPDDGAGCEGARLYTRQALRAAIAERALPADYVVQPYIEGIPASLSVLCRDGAAWLLSANRQRVRLREGGFRLDGVVVNGLAADQAPLAALGARVAAALPGLWGYVGIDLVQAEDGMFVLEVNPRLTTSYAGLREALGINPAALVLALTHADPLLPPGRHVTVDVDVELGCAA